MNYTIQCTDVLSGQIGSFGFSDSQYLSESEPLKFKAITPIFASLPEFFLYAKHNNIMLESKPINWKPQL